jgi:hypothetical protein
MLEEYSNAQGNLTIMAIIRFQQEPDADKRAISQKEEEQNDEVVNLTGQEETSGIPPPSQPPSGKRIKNYVAIL